MARLSLDDKYDLAKDRVFVSGTQAVVRLLLMQKERDRRAGLNTAGFVSGYRGSPLGGLDQQIWRAEKALKANDIVFRPGLNEDLAATAVWGSQQAEVRGEGRYDGVFGIWYGKGPGVDRSRRRLPPCEFRRRLAAWRRHRADGRRPHLRKLDLRAPVGIRVPRRDDADPQSGRRAGNPRLRARRLGDVALHRALGRPEMRQGQYRGDGGGRRAARPRPLRAAGNRRAAGRAQHPRRPARAGEGGAAASLAPARGARLHPREPSRPDHDGGRAAARASASSRSARAGSIRSARSISLASTRSAPPISGCGSTRWRRRGRWRRTASTASPKAWRRSSSWRRSARSSRRRSRSSFTAAPARPW